jgi:hypothetical protein
MFPTFDSSDDVALSWLPSYSQALLNRKCQVTSTSAWTMADAKIDPVFRQVQP